MPLAATDEAVSRICAINSYGNRGQTTKYRSMLTTIGVLGMTRGTHVKGMAKTCMFRSQCVLESLQSKSTCRVVLALFVIFVCDISFGTCPIVSSKESLRKHAVITHSSRFKFVDGAEVHWGTSVNGAMLALCTTLNMESIELGSTIC